MNISSADIVYAMMQNLAGHSKASQICADELQAAGIGVDVLTTPYGEPKSLIGGKLGGFTFRRAWVYWCVEGSMSFDHAHALNVEPRPQPSQETKYSGYAATWGDVIRVRGFSGGTSVDANGCESWHIDTPEGLKKFADHVRTISG